MISIHECIVKPRMTLEDVSMVLTSIYVTSPAEGGHQRMKCQIAQVKPNIVLTIAALFELLLIAPWVLLTRLSVFFK